MEIHRVLLVDDDDDIRTITAMTLSAVAGWEVIEAASGEEAIDQAVTKLPDLVLLDVMMPGLDGPATLEALKTHEQLRHLPVIFLTAKVNRGVVEQLKRLGAVGVIGKPFDPMTLPEQVRQATQDL